MIRSTVRRACALAVLALLALGLAPLGAQAEERPVDRDWRTGVPVAANARTWMDAPKEKQRLMNDTAAAQGKTCTHYAFIGWPVGSGGPDVIMRNTRANYEAAGFTIKDGKAEVASTDTVWLASGKDGRDAVILWGNVMGSTIYLSCLTGGAPAADPLKPLFIGVLLALGLGCLGAGLWLLQRTRALALASTTWPTTQGTVRSSDVIAYRTMGGHQYIAKVAYDYEVGGKPYRGDRLRFGQIATVRAKADADAAKYAVGSSVPVHYAPRQPQTATLEAGSGSISVAGAVLAGVGAALALFGLLFAVV